MSRRLHIIFVVSFFLILLFGSVTPLAQWTLGEDRNFSKTENRRLMTFGNIGKDAKRINDLTSNMERAVSDQIPFRDLIVRKFRRFQVYAFNHDATKNSPLLRKNILLGRNGHWYLTGTNTFSHIPCASPKPTVPALQKSFVKAIVGFDKWLASEGKSLSVIIVPLQNTLDPSNLPSGLSERCQQGFPPLQTSISELNAQGVNILYDPKWMKKEGVEKFYDPRSFHWNPGGALRYSKHGVDKNIFSKASIKLAPMAPRVRDLETDVDLGRYMGIAPLVQKYSEPIVLQRFLYRRKIRDALKDNRIPAELVENYSGTISKYAETDNVKNGKGLIIGDSFSEGTFDFWARQFSATLQGTTNTLKPTPGRFRNLVNEFNPDHVVLVFEESKLTPIEGGPTWRTIGNMLGPLDED